MNKKQEKKSETDLVEINSFHHHERTENDCAGKLLSSCIQSYEDYHECYSGKNRNSDETIEVKKNLKILVNIFSNLIMILIVSSIVIR